MPLGVSYQPGADVQFDQGTGGNLHGVRGASPQEAVRLLNLRIPQSRTAGAGGLAPLPLLNAAGGGGSDLDMLLKALLQAFGQSGQGQSFGGAQPTPRVIPGVIDTTGGTLEGPSQAPVFPPNTPLDSTGRTLGNGGFASGILNGGQPLGLQQSATPKQIPQTPAWETFLNQKQGQVQPLF